MALTLMYITNDPKVAKIAEQNGVDRIWIDLETLGKAERQGGMDTVQSKHSIEDIRVMKPVLSESKLLVRINPMNPESKPEIDSVISAGADMIMLPMYKSAQEVKEFLDYVDGRVRTVLLLETKEAAECLDEVLRQGGFDEIHIGLNDLHLSLGMNFMFELLADGTVERLCNIIRSYEIPYGFGGIARLGMGDLPAEKVIMEHYRLGSTRAILSRSFCNYEKFDDYDELDQVFRQGMINLREYEESLNNKTQEEFESNQKEVKEKVDAIVKRKIS